MTMIQAGVPALVVRADDLPDLTADPSPEAPQEVPLRQPPTEIGRYNTGRTAWINIHNAGAVSLRVFFRQIDAVPEGTQYRTLVVNDSLFLPIEAPGSDNPKLWVGGVGTGGIVEVIAGLIG